MEELCIVQEVGMFGNLEVEDPTCKSVDKKKNLTQDELDELIQKTHANNMNNY